MLKKCKYVLLIAFLSYNLYGENNIGYTLLYGNCTTCHYETRSLSAPSLKIVKERYKLAFPIKEDFVKYMSSWVLKPNQETSIMQDMIQKYELMPELGYDKDTLEKIANYIYETDFKSKTD